MKEINKQAQEPKELTTLEDVAYKVRGLYRYLTIDEMDNGMRFAYISKYKPNCYELSLVGFNYYWHVRYPYTSGWSISLASSLLYSLNPAKCYDLYEYRPKE